MSEKDHCQVSLKICFLEAYFGGSHRAFAEGLQKHSRHQIHILSLPAHKWKWRMRHAAITFRQWIIEAHDRGEHFDLFFCTSMLNLAELKGLLPQAMREKPFLYYFHENQLTYPNQKEEERDIHYAFNQWVSAQAADAVWFNSAFHRNDFYLAMRKLLKRMPDYPCLDVLDETERKSEVYYPPIHSQAQERKKNTQCHLLWAARWEHDKQAEVLFKSLLEIKKQGLAFKLIILGQSFQSIPPIFKEAKQLLDDHIIQWGYVEDQQDYWHFLSQTDIAISTAAHEFYGLSVLEAISAGAYPLLPKRLSYPELLDLEAHPERESFFYRDGELSQSLAIKISDFEQGTLWPKNLHFNDLWSKFGHRNQIPYFDDACHKLLDS